MSAISNSQIWLAILFCSKDLKLKAIGILFSYKILSLTKCTKGLTMMRSSGCLRWKKRRSRKYFGSPIWSLGKSSPELVLKTPVWGKACTQSLISQSWVNREGPSSEGLDTAFASPSQSKTQKTKDWVRQWVGIKNSERPRGMTYNLTIWNVEAGK